MRLSNIFARGIHLVWALGVIAASATRVVGFNSDGKTDILWRHQVSGENTAWLMGGANGSTYLSSAALLTINNPDWKIVGIGDFNNDGQLDILWRHVSQGINAVWYMTGSTFMYSGTIQTVDLSWEIVGTGYFDFDAHIDILWRSKVTGQNVIWFMNDTTQIGQTYIQAQTDLNWKIVGTGDFNIDGQCDILWRNAANGQNAVWYMNGSAYVSTGTLQTVSDTNWEIVGTGYFDPGYQIDILWRHRSGGGNVIWFMNGIVQGGSTYIADPGDNNWKIVGTGDSRVDSDSDGMPDLGERNVFGNLNQIATGDHDGDGLLNLQEVELSFNVPVNSPAYDAGNEQNTQFESTCAVLNGKVIVAYVDSNLGVYGLGQDTRLSSLTPRFVGYSVSLDGGLNFQDKTAPPLSTQGSGTADDGDGGDPVLAVDTVSSIVYLAGTSSRNAGWKGIPLWKSTDGGVTFADPPTNVRTDIINSDKPWIAVDNASGTGQHDVYVVCIDIQLTPQRMWLTASANGSLNNWTTPLVVRQSDTNIVKSFTSPIIVTGSDHVGYLVWFERATNNGAGDKNWLKTCKVLNHGASLGNVSTVCQLVTTDSDSGNLLMKRSNGASSSDTFSAFPFPVVAVNPLPAKSNHLYVAYADKGQGTDKADIFLVRSVNGGDTWTAPVTVNANSANDQWMPVIAVKPDGSKLFVAWYDRRGDTANNSLIGFYGRWGTINPDGSVTFAAHDHRITTANFPAVFAGTLGPPYTNPGYYDPVYPPGGVNLNWHWSALGPSARPHSTAIRAMWESTMVPGLTAHTCM